MFRIQILHCVLQEWCLPPPAAKVLRHSTFGMVSVTRFATLAGPALPSTFETGVLVEERVDCVWKRKGVQT